MNIISWVYLASLVIGWVVGLFMLILIWGLGVIGVFTWIYNKLHFSPKIIRYFTAGALSFISFFIVFISWPVGIFRFATLVDTWKKWNGEKL